MLKVFLSGAAGSVIGLIALMLVQACSADTDPVVVVAVCDSAYECPQPEGNGCQVAVCVEGRCGSQEAVEGEPCKDGATRCVSGRCLYPCITSADCPTSGDPCAELLCTNPPGYCLPHDVDGGIGCP